MGGGSWDHKLYKASASFRAEKHIADFAYHEDTFARLREEWKAASELEPKKIKDTVMHVRESRDSLQHPESRAVMVMFDVTGSMRGTPKIFQKKMEKLMSFIVMKGGLEHPQILVGGIGDVTCDQVPLQVSQFESSNLIDEHLRKMFLEGGGGDGQHESYELALYFAAKLTALDCLEKRGQKGYIFIIGDEVSYTDVSRKAVKKVFGIDEQADIPLEDILNEAMDKFQIYFIMPSGTNHWKQEGIVNFWKKLLGQNFLLLEKPEAVCELIASTIALNEGVDLGEVSTALEAVGADKTTVGEVSKSLATYKAAPRATVSRSTATAPAASKDSISRL